MKTNDLKKGDRVLLATGEQNGDIATCNDFATWERLQLTGSSFKAWEGTIHDNRKGVRRMVEVEGFYKEIGDVYAHDIIAYQADGKWLPVEHTPAQLKLRQDVKNFFKD
jgi:hypothetical protein